MLISNVDVCIGLGHEEEGDIRTMDIELDFNDYSCGLTVVCIITINTNYLELSDTYSRQDYSGRIKIYYDVSLTSSDTIYFDINSLGTATIKTSYEYPNSGSYYIGIKGFFSDSTLAFSTENATLLDVVECGGNSPPTANDDAANVVVGSGLNQIDVLGNDNDPDDDTLTIIDVGNPSYATVTITDNCIYYILNTLTTGDIVDQFTYTISDGNGQTDTATVYITIVNNIIQGDDEGSTEDGNMPDTNSRPIANNDYITVTRGSANNQIDVLANDEDPEEDELLIINVEEPLQGYTHIQGSYIYYTHYVSAILNDDTDHFTYQISDGNGKIDTATVYVTIIDDDGNDEDSGDKNSLDEGPPANYPPQAYDDSSYTTNQNQEINVDAANGVLANDEDEDALTAVLISEPSPEGCADFFNLYSDGGFKIIPATDYYGDIIFTYKAYDGVNYSNIATVTVNVIQVLSSTNTVPVANDDYFTKTGMQTVLHAEAPGVLANDEDDDSLTTILVRAPNHGTINLQSTGEFWYTQDSGFTGVDSFTYKANDGEDDSNIAIVYINVEEQTVDTNIAPVAIDDSWQVRTNQILTVSQPGVLENDFDLNQDSITAVLVSNPANGVLNFYEDGSFEYIPNNGFIGIDSFSYKVNDGEDNSEVATVTLEVLAVVVNTDNTDTNEEDEEQSVETEEIPIDSVTSNDQVIINPNHVDDTIYEVNYRANRDMNNSKLSIVKRIDKPVEIKDDPIPEKIKDKPKYQGATVYKYMDIKLTENEKYVSNQKMTFKFKVSRDWIEQENIDDTTITMARWNNSNWTYLETSIKDNGKEEYIYFETETPGLSTFAIVGGKIVTNDGGDKDEQKIPWMMIFLVIVFSSAVLVLILFKKRFIYLEKENS